MKSNEFSSRFGKYDNKHSLSDSDQRGMKLRDADPALIPKGARGPYAPDLEPIHMTRLFLALTAPDKASNAADVVKEYAKLKAEGKQLFKKASDLETALTAIFQGEIDKEGKFKFDVKEVIICRSWPEAKIVLVDGQEFKFNTLEPPVHDKQLCRIDFHVSWEFFHDILSRVASEQGYKHLKREIKSDEDSEAYRQWHRKIREIAKEQGDEAAHEYAKNHPFKSKKHGVKNG